MAEPITRVLTLDNFGISELATTHDVVEVLSAFPDPFSISVGDRQDSTTLRKICKWYRPYDGVGNFVWLSNNQIGSKAQEQGGEKPINAFFRLDRTGKRVLVDPEKTAYSRDDYRAWGNEFYYGGTLVDILHLLAERYSFYQITTLAELSALAIRQGVVHTPEPYRLDMTFNAHQAQFQQATGIADFEAYQIDGELDLERVLAENWKPVDMAGFQEPTYGHRLLADWGIFKAEI